MKGIILAGGAGTRLHPLTLVTSKQLLPVYDKPMIYHSISTLMLAGIREILIITTAEDQAAFQKVLGNGGQWGLTLSYAVQSQPRGLAEAYIIGADFVGDEPSMLILGDNIFHGHGFADLLKEAITHHSGATIFTCQVRDPQRYGVITFDKKGRAISIEEKPSNPKSSWAVTGLYLYDPDVVEVAQNLTPSDRGELEITDVNSHYLDADKLSVRKMGRGYAWLDAGTHDALLQTANYLQTLEERQGLKVACLEEIALGLGYIDRHQVQAAAVRYGRSGYRDYLERMLTQLDDNP